MARVVALCADLMFGSKLVAQLAAAGEQLELSGDVRAVRERLSSGEGARRVLVVDLTDEELGGTAFVRSLRSDPQAGGSAPDGLRTLGFYAHVDRAARERAERAGFDLVVPRSRMAREGAELVVSLLEDAPARRTSG
jgi:hypothetical protein